MNRIGLIWGLGLVLFGPVTTFAGPSVSGGGGAVIYQAQAISLIMNDVSSRMDIGFMFMHKNESGGNEGETIKTIELLGWANGTSHYEITTSSGCQLYVDTIADETADAGGPTTFKTIWQPRSCNGVK